ncbi:MAG TPA: hypothetical protein VH394_30720 [Thermoanaerobaculia bacterium]|nr:hypothetical protein [Thermoanaerobaculia bacterium]
MSKERKNVMAAVLLAFAVLAMPVPAQAREPRGGRESEPGRAWMVRLLDWLGLSPQGLGSIWEADSAHIDPDGLP